MVESYLSRKGYRILERNYLKRSGEIDLIAKDRNETVFIEVKTRKTNTYGRPEEAVGRDKIRKIEKTALHWLSSNKKLDTPWRIDIIALELTPKTHITHLENVTL
jgi:putative endonuclease